MAEPVLTMIILACTLNVSDAQVKDTDLNVAVPKWENQATADNSDFFRDPENKSCETYATILDPFVAQGLTPYTCMMKSAIHLPEFMEKHPGMLPRKWTCRMMRPLQGT